MKMKALNWVFPSLEIILAMSPTSTKNLLLFFLSNLLLFKADSKCQPSYSCNNISFEFPFTDINYPKCGLFLINCTLSKFEKSPRVYLGREHPYDLLEKVAPNKFLILDTVLQNYIKGNSCFSLSTVSLPKSPVSFSYSHNITIFACYKPDNETKLYFAKFKNTTCDNLELYYKIPPIHFPETDQEFLPKCIMNQLPLKSDPDYSANLFNLLTPNFTLEWNLSKACYDCYLRGGLCLSDGKSILYCKQGSSTVDNIIFIGGMTIVALASTLMIVFVFIRRKRAKAKQKYEKDIKLFLKNNGYLAPLRYKYSSIKKMTNSFGENLGKGGYGSVYKGQLPDGHLVAVKLLNESNENGKDFMNEVASISRTSHINIVALLGFCFEGPKRALIYDFMPNGSLEKFIGSSAFATAEIGLGWNKLFEIAVGIARGLEYLHQGCSTRILHLDIKPHNILLDKDLNPKISDFGLAKLCPNRSSIVSMMVARGTIGYIAPEVFSRNFGEVSYKSDVYSYGMLVLEMVGGRKNLEPGEVDHTSEMYFPHYIQRQLERDAERDGYLSMNQDESQVAKRNLMIIGLWCIQTNPKDRPSMTKVVEMLEGKLGELEVPPRHYFNSPPRSAPTISSNSQSL